MGHLLTKVKRWLRRQRECYLPNEQTRAYRRWIARRLRERAMANYPLVEPGLFSVLTAVWDGTPPRYFETLAATIQEQNSQWVICDNGCRKRELVSVLDRLRALPGVEIVGNGDNVGIAGGLLRCLHAATSRYIVPVDADDDLYPHALPFAASFIRKHNFPPLLYSDEDKVIGSLSSQPYFKPDFDPVLLANSAYTAHLAFIDREKALALGVYTDRAAEGSIDWDLFLRFVSAGYDPIHIPEVLYRWRIHVDSTADDSAAKDYIGRSQRAALQGFLHRHPAGTKFTVVESPLLPGGAHFRLLRSADNERWPHAVVRPSALREQLPRDARLVFVAEGDVKPEWISEASGIFELFSDTAIVGARLLDANGRILDADRHFGFGGGCASPNTGRSHDDPGYFGQVFKQHTASAVSARLMAVERTFFELALETTDFSPCALGTKAMREKRRVVYSPYISATLSRDSADEATATQTAPDRRYYPEPFSLERPFRID